MPLCGYKQTEEHKRKAGEGHKGKKLSEEHRRKLSESHKAPRPWMIGRKHTLEARQKMSRTNKIRLLKSENNGFWGKKHTEEARRKMSLAKIGKYVGEKCHFWKGGITPMHIAIRMSSEYKLWREAVFKRDNWTCVWCGDNRGGNLNADHIKLFSLYPELRFKIENGRTLCENCHKWKTKWDKKIYFNCRFYKNYVFVG